MNGEAYAAYEQWALENGVAKTPERWGTWAACWRAARPDPAPAAEPAGFYDETETVILRALSECEAEDAALPAGVPRLPVPKHVVRALRRAGLLKEAGGQ